MRWQHARKRATLKDALSGSVDEVIFFSTSNDKVKAKNQHEKAAKRPFVFVSHFKMLQKHYNQHLISAQIIGSSINFLTGVTAQRAGLLQWADRQL